MTHRPRLTLAPARRLRDRLVARDESALRELVESAAPWLLGLARTMVQETADAEEIVMESFRHVWDRAASLPEGDDALVAWLLTTTRHRAIDLLRSRRRRAVREEKAHRFAVAEAPFSPPDVIDEAGGSGWPVHRRVHAALAELPEAQQEALQLAYFGGYTQSEIAERLAVPLGTVKTRVRRALLTLRETLQDVRGLA